MNYDLEWRATTPISDKLLGVSENKTVIQAFRRAILDYTPVLAFGMTLQVISYVAHPSGVHEFVMRVLVLEPYDRETDTLH